MASTFIYPVVNQWFNWLQQMCEGIGGRNQQLRARSPIDQIRIRSDLSRCVEAGTFSRGN